MKVAILIIMNITTKNTNLTLDQENYTSSSPQQFNQKRLFGVGILLLFVMLMLITISYQSMPARVKKPTLNPTSPSQVKIPTPMPFEEMTIPYLQKKSYKSTLSDLKLLKIHANYTSYLTSYTSDSLRINGLLTIPNGQAPRDGWRAVVFIHGYIPPTQYNTTQNYASYVDALARSGLVVFKIDLRGHDQSEGEPTGAYYSSDYIIDTLHAVSALQSTDFVNPDSIGLWGHSMAGNVVMRSVASSPSIAAAVIWAGAVYTYDDMQKYGIDDNSYRPPQLSTPRQQRRQRLREIYGEFKATHPFWRQVAITEYVNNVKAPIQIHHALDDNVVNIGYSRDLISLLKTTQTKHELFEYTNGGHNLSGNSFNQAMQRSVEFYKINL